MKTTAIVGVSVAAIGIVVGSQIPKSGTAGYAVITGTKKNKEAAKEYFQNITKFSKECGFTTLVLDRNTDIREGNVFYLMYLMESLLQGMKVKR